MIICYSSNSNPIQWIRTPNKGKEDTEVSQTSSPQIKRFHFIDWQSSLTFLPSSSPLSQLFYMDLLCLLLYWHLSYPACHGAILIPTPKFPQLEFLSSLNCWYKYRYLLISICFLTLPQRFQTTTWGSKYSVQVWLTLQ